MVTYKYLVHGVCLESDTVFPEFTPLPSGQREILLLREPASPSGVGEVAETHLLRRGCYITPQGGTESFAYFGLSEYYVARWNLLCDFQVSRDGAWIRCYPWAGVAWSDIKPFLLGRVLPLALSLRGALVLHSGAILLPQGAVALVGDSGMGKSSLATILASGGHPLVADDVLVIADRQGDQFVELGFSHVRLTRESLEALAPLISCSRRPEPDFDKYRVCLQHNGMRAGPMPLKGIYLLNRRPQEEGRDVHFFTLPPRESLLALLSKVTNCHLLERSQLKRQFEMLARLVDRVPIKVLSYPSGLELLPQVCAALLEDQGTTEPPGRSLFQATGVADGSGN